MHRSINLSLEVISSSSHDGKERRKVNERRKDDKLVRAIEAQPGDTIDFTSQHGEVNLTFHPKDAVKQDPVTKQVTVVKTPFTYSPSLVLPGGRRVGGLPHQALS